MPFTLAHPAAILPLLRKPFVPAALVAGSMAPDIPYFLNAADIKSTHAGDWYEPILNATHAHSLSGLPIDLLYAVALVVAYRLMRAPITALLPAGLSLPRPKDTGNKAQYIGWLAISALLGIATHVAWDRLTEIDLLPSRLLQYASTAFGLVVVGSFLWKRRAQLRNADDRTPHLGTSTRRAVVVLLIAAPLLGAAALAGADYSDFNETSGSFASVAEGVLTGAAKRAGASFTLALLLYTAAWQLSARKVQAVSRR
jgi:uncharacterized protein DUF4184